LVVKLLAKNAEARYADAAELAEDLRRARDGLSPIAAGNDAGATRVAAQETVPTPPIAAGRWRGGLRRSWVLAATLAPLIMLGCFGWGLSQDRWEQGLTPADIGRADSIEVPDVEGLTEEQARQKLTASGFKVDVRRRRSSAAEARKVLDQSPPGGERAKEGSGVVLDVGDDPASLRVPKVVGLSVSEVKARLGEAGLTVGSQRKVPSYTTAEGVVVEQGYPAGTEVAPGTAVNIGVSSGPQQVGAPDAPPPSTTASATATPTATAPALGEDVGERVGGNSGPGSDNSEHGSSGGEGN
jgi:serine/threonine-protein kinase